MAETFKITKSRPELAEPARRISNVLRFTKLFLGKVSNGRYSKVVRGAVNWPNWPFDAHPRGAAIFMDESTLLRRKNHCALTLELAMKMPADVGDEQDDALDDMRSDVVKVFTMLADYQLFDPDNPTVSLTYRVHTDNDLAMEWSDASLMIQGLRATAFVEV